MQAKKERMGPLELIPTKVEQIQMTRAIEFLSTIGVEIKTPVLLATNLGEGIVGLYRDKKIYISKLAFAKGTKYLAGTLLEEWAHAEMKQFDYSREFQNWLIDKIISIGEEKNGEPL
jgi:hypothetical protein